MRKFNISMVATLILVAGGIACLFAPWSPVEAGGVRELTGLVLDQAGQPVAGYPVRLEVLGTNKTYSAVTDHEGRFVLFNLPLEKYFVYPVNHPRELGKSIQVDINTLEKTRGLVTVEPIRLPF